jgi:hypothetical protein
MILPEGGQSLTRLETDPRLHKLLRQAVAQRGQIATSQEGLRVLRAAAMWDNELEADDGQGTKGAIKHWERSFLSRNVPSKQPCTLAAPSSCVYLPLGPDCRWYFKVFHSRAGFL